MYHSCEILNVASCLLHHSALPKPRVQCMSDELRRFRIEKQLNWSIKLPSQSLDWWREHQKSFPHLAILAKSYLAIPATSAPSERIFSTASIIGSKRRANLQPQKLEKLIFLNKNIKRAEKYFNQIMALCSGEYSLTWRALVAGITKQLFARMVLLLN